MKIQNNPITTLHFVNVLLFATILSIPLYFIRIPLFTTSLSILTCFLITLSIILLIAHHKRISTIFKKEKTLWYFALFFVLSFVPILILHPSLHGLGVFVEWLFIPAFTGFLIFVHTTQHTTARTWINAGILTILFFVSCISLLYLFHNTTTFDGRLQAYFLSPNHLAMFIAPLIFFVVAYLITTQTLFIKIISFLTLLLASTTLFFTYSFSTLFALLFSGLLITVILIKQKILLFLTITLIITSLFFVGYQKIIHSNTDWQRNSFTSRLMIWDSALLHIQNNIALSSGIDNFQQDYLSTQRYFEPYLEWSAPTPHNLLLTLWISGGFFSVLFFCLLCARWLYLSIRTYYKTKNTVILLYIAALLTILLSSILDTPYWKNDLSIIFWIIIGSTFIHTISTKSIK
ncbi:MAG: O-antigen ligase family protein [Patescibacteria group bacterium]|nr:O-antigen ligase family protein [Patescibacteria group bacterium]